LIIILNKNFFCKQNTALRRIYYFKKLLLAFFVFY